MLERVKKDRPMYAGARALSADSRLSMEPPSCTAEEFQHFFNAKAFDVIGNGTFRKHLARCREAGDLWAVEMSSNVQSVQSHIREISSAVVGMPQTSNRLHEICREVMMGAQPPTKLHAGCVKCCITLRQCMRCMDLTRNHKSSAHMFVDARFCFFFMLLWYCNKLEYIIRSFTRTWLDTRDDKETFEQQCLAIQEELKPQIDSMYKLFVIAKSHIIKTLAHYEQSHKLSLF